MQNLKISLVQTPLDWQQPESNRTRLAELIAPLAGQTDLVVLPEMFTTGFTMEPEAVAEPMSGPTLEWLRAQAATQGWRILPQVCYDLRFPVWCRNRNDYDLALFVANWPAPRRNAWRTLLLARAIENQCYVAGVNRIGEDGKGLEYSGDSLLVDFKGQALLDASVGEAFVKTGTLNADDLQRFRDNFPAWQDADEFSFFSDVEDDFA
jgi:predicted amidohydrolase